MAVLNSAKITSKITSSSGEETQLTTTSNIHRANNVDTDIVIVKTASKDWLAPKDTVTITTVITNNTDENIENIKVTDTISEGATFVEGSVQLGAFTYPNYNVVDGFTMPITLGGSGNEVRFTYDILVDTYLNVDKITDTSKLDFRLGSEQFSINSDALEMNVLVNDVYLLKEADKSAVKSGDIITYTITISNDGAYTNTDIMFTDTIPDSTTFVAGSVKINDIEKSDYDPNVGFPLDDLSTNSSIKVEFKVQVN